MFVSPKTLSPFTFLPIIALIACAAQPQPAVPPAPSDQPVPSTYLQPPSAARSEWAWTTIQGEARTYLQTWDRLQRIMDESGVSGLSLTLTQADSWMANPDTYFFDFGRTYSEGGSAVDSTTMFPARRLGQPVFGYLALKLVDRGQFDIDHPLYKYLPKPLAEYPAYADLATDSRAKSLTARWILTQRSGLANSRADRSDGKLVFERSPGGYFGYSEEGYGFLKFVLEQKFGRSFNDLAKEVVFDFLTLREMSFTREPRFQDQPAGIVAGRPESEPSALPAFWTSSADYNRFIWAVMVSGGAFANPYIGLPYHVSQTIVRSPSVLEPPRASGRLDLPLAFGWSFGWGCYYIEMHKVECIGERGPGIEYYATVVSRLPGKITILTFIAAGKASQSVARRILLGVMGDIEPPLVWLGLEDKTP